MEDINSITLTLESYLKQLGELSKRWLVWLSQNELAVFSADTHQLLDMEVAGQALMRELSDISSQRQQILDSACGCGLRAGNLQNLARQLPEWNQGELRVTLAAAKQQLAAIRRLHVAAWVLISQRLSLLRDRKAIMMCGSLRHDVYVNTPHCDNGGGQLLDASL